MSLGCFLDEDEKAQLRVSKAIETELKSWKKEAGREFKLLLLGSTQLKFVQLKQHIYHWHSVIYIPYIHTSAILLGFLNALPFT